MSVDVKKGKGKTKIGKRATAETVFRSSRRKVKYVITWNAKGDPDVRTLIKE